MTSLLGARSFGATQQSRFFGPKNQPSWTTRDKVAFRIILSFGSQELHINGLYAPTAPCGKPHLRRRHVQIAGAPPALASAISAPSAIHPTRFSTAREENRLNPFSLLLTKTRSRLMACAVINRYSFPTFPRPIHLWATEAGLPGRVCTFGKRHCMNESMILHYPRNKRVISEM